MRKGRTFIISGPSGVGKSTVLKSLLAKRDNVYFSVSATTRAPREGEEDGVHYHFIDVDMFRDWIGKNEFLEYAEYVGNFYGTPKKYVDAAMDAGQDVIFGYRGPGSNPGGKQAARYCADFHCTSQLGGTGAPSGRTWN